MNFLYKRLRLEKPIQQSGFNSIFTIIFSSLNLLPQCGHYDTCNIGKATRDTCTRYEVPHIEGDIARFYFVPDGDTDPDDLKKTL